MTDKEFKPIDNALIKEIRSDLEQNIEKFKDPMILGELSYRLLEERENTNRLLKTLIARLDGIENSVKLELNSRLDAIESKLGQPPSQEAREILLPEVDEQMLSFVKGQGKVTAEEVRKKFSYRGKNAASARLNRLCDLGLLSKKQVGRKVFFFPL